MYIFSARALASCRRRPLSSNVRPHKSLAAYRRDPQMTSLRCKTCDERLPTDAYRQSGKGSCKWCEWAPMEKRAAARYADKARAHVVERLQISKPAFVRWYCSQPDCCHYCGLTMPEVKRLRLRRGGFGHFVSWDVDRKDSSKPYQRGNMVLSCFICNMAKGNLLTEAEAKVVGGAVRRVFRARLRATRRRPSAA